MSQSKEAKDILKTFLCIAVIVGLFMWLCSCRAYKPDGSPTWNTRQLMKKDSVGIMIGHGYRTFKKLSIDNTNTVKK